MGNFTSRSSGPVVPKVSRKVAQDRSHGGVKFLCFHGWRTSGEILKTQTNAFRGGTGIDCDFPDALYYSQGEPDDLVAMFYPSPPHAYFEWFIGDGYQDKSKTIESSLDYIIEFIDRNGPYDGILGFSQGAAFATSLLSRLQETQSSYHFKIAILVGGVAPPSGAIFTPTAFSN